MEMGTEIGKANRTPLFKKRPRDTAGNQRPNSKTSICRESIQNYFKPSGKKMCRKAQLD